MSSKDKVDLKVVFLGDSSVGKTCLLIRFLDDSFGDTSTTIGASYFKKTMARQGESISLGLWDTAGQERYDSLSSFYCRGAGCAIVAFDLTSPDSLSSVSRWMEKLHASNPDTSCFTLLIGTKLDVVNDNRTAITQKAIDDVMRKHNIDMFVKTSAKTGENVQLVFEKIVEKHAERKGSSSASQRQQQQVRLHQHQHPQKRKGGCC